MRADNRAVQGRPPLLPMRAGQTERPLVLLVDDDASLREALSELVQSAGLEPACFASTAELLETDLLDAPGCLVLDVRLPGTSGLDLQERLLRSGNPKPIIFLTGHGDIPMTVRAMKAGAVDFLTKPFRDQDLLDAVSAGIAIDVERRTLAAVVRRNVERLESLTPREREVLREVARGRVNKQIAFDLGIREVTVKLHRSNVMRKMQVVSIAELIRVWETLPMTLREAGRD